MKFYLLILSLILCVNLYAQKGADFYLIHNLNYEELYEEDKILLDSNLTKYHSNKSNDSVKVEALAVICENMYDPIWIDYQKFQLGLIKDLSALSPSYYLSKAEGNALNNMGFYYDMEGDTKKALNYYNQSLILFDEISYHDGKAIACNNMGFVYQMEGNIPKAIDFFHKSLLISEKTENLNGIAYASNNLGTIYGNEGNNEKALEYYTESAQIEKEIGNQEGEATSLSNMGHAHGNMGNQEKALQYFLQALEIRQEINDLRGMANSMNNIGSLYRKKESYDKAITYFKSSIEYYNSIGSKKGITTGNINLAGAYYQKNEYSIAWKYASDALELANELGYPEELSEASLIHAMVGSKMGKWESSYNSYVVHVKMRDSIKNDDITALSLKYQYDLEYAKKSSADSIIQAEALKVKNAEVAANKAEAEKQKIAANSQKQYTYWMLGVAILFAVFAIVLFNRFKYIRKQNEIIKKQKIESDIQRGQIQEQHLQLEETHREISDSINYAQHLQKAILPDKDKLKESLGEGFVLFQPKDVVSGDFYWMHQLEDSVLLAVADCTGHGVPGAMVSVVCSNALNRSVKEFGLVRPSQILDKTRELVIETFSKSGKNIRDGMDISLIKLSENEVSFSGANNPLWIIRNEPFVSTSEQIKVLNNGNFSLIELLPNRQPIGYSDSPEPFKESSFTVKKDDTLFLFTDGYADQFGGPKGKKFKYKPFKNYLIEINSKSLNEQRDAIAKTFHDWKGDIEQVDDVCIIGVRI